jgi:HTH-type transcriptional regulator/antitoxin HigA
MFEFRTLDEVSVEYYSEQPEEINDFLKEIFTDYAQDGDSSAIPGQKWKKS